MKPGKSIYPQEFVDRIKGKFKGIDNVDIDVLDVKDMQRNNMGALLGVGQGSVHDPRLLVISYSGADSNDAPIALVGKGITFDTGGISLKPNNNMWFMKSDLSGAAAVASLSSDVVEFVGIDVGIVAEGQNALETGVTLCAQDTSGPFDYHMLQKFKALCRENDIPHQIDIFRYYYSDANSAVRAGHDVRDALITFGTDATHGYERTHISSLMSIARLLSLYAYSPPIYPVTEGEIRRFPHVIEKRSTGRG